MRLSGSALGLTSGNSVSQDPLGEPVAASSLSQVELTWLVSPVPGLLKACASSIPVQSVTSVFRMCPAAVIPDSLERAGGDV